MPDDDLGSSDEGSHTHTHTHNIWKPLNDKHFTSWTTQVWRISFFNYKVPLRELENHEAVLRNKTGSVCKCSSPDKRLTYQWKAEYLMSFFIFKYIWDGKEIKMRERNTAPRNITSKHKSVKHTYTQISGQCITQNTKNQGNQSQTQYMMHKG